MLTNEDRAKIRKLVRHEAINAILENQTRESRIVLCAYLDPKHKKVWPELAFGSFDYDDLDSSLPISDRP